MHKVGIELHELFASLSDPTRIRIVKLLVATGEEVCLCEFSDAMNEPEYKLSKHLKILKSTGLLNSFRDGKWIYHGLVKKDVYLKSLYKLLSAFPDEEKVFTADLNRFKKRMKLRENGRCRTGLVRQDISERKIP